MDEKDTQVFTPEPPAPPPMTAADLNRQPEPDIRKTLKPDMLDI